MTLLSLGGKSSSLATGTIPRSLIASHCHRRRPPLRRQAKPVARRRKSSSPIMASLASSFSALLLLRRIPIPLRTLCPFPSWSRRFSVDHPAAQDVLPAPAAAAAGDSASFPTTAFGTRDALLGSRVDHPDYRRWKEQEEEILNDVEPVILLAKEILHSDRCGKKNRNLVPEKIDFCVPVLMFCNRRYQDGERLSEQDEKVIIDKLLSYHPHAEDKIGCGLDSIMVRRKLLFFIFVHS